MNKVLVVFSKTPCLSSVKTRIGEVLGEEFAISFYKKCINATHSYLLEVMRRDENLSVVWAVAEKLEDVGSFWSGKNIIEQGCGDLGERLHRIYSKLIKKYDMVFFMGADSPHLSSKKIWSDINQFSKGKEIFSLGFCLDGGFYLFGGKSEIPKKVWLETKYSAGTTGEELFAHLQSLGEISLFSKEFDLDRVEDFKLLFINNKMNDDDLTIEQKELKDWLKEKY